MEITLSQFEGSNIMKGFTPETVSSKVTLEDVEKSLNDNFEKGLIDEELFNKAIEELNILKGCGVKKAEEEKTPTEECQEIANGGDSEEVDGVEKGGEGSGRKPLGKSLNNIMESGDSNKTSKTGLFDGKETPKHKTKLSEVILSLNEEEAEDVLNYIKTKHNK